MKLFVHAGIEVPNKEVRPEVIKTLHVVIILADAKLFTLFQGMRPKVTIQLVYTLVRDGFEGIDSALSILSPEDWR